MQATAGEDNFIILGRELSFVVLLIGADLTQSTALETLQISGNCEYLLRTRDIPGLVNPSPPCPQHGLQSFPLRHCSLYKRAFCAPPRLYLFPLTFYSSGLSIP